MHHGTCAEFSSQNIDRGAAEPMSNYSGSISYLDEYNAHRAGGYAHGQSDDHRQALRVQCSPKHFICDRSMRCIPHYWRCDGHKDCWDRTDEANCTNVTCPHPGMHRCRVRTGLCTKSAWLCDGVSDCGPDDLSDEENC